MKKQFFIILSSLIFTSCNGSHDCSYSKSHHAKATNTTNQNIEISVCNIIEVPSHNPRYASSTIRIEAQQKKEIQLRNGTIHQFYNHGDCSGPSTDMSDFKLTTTSFAQYNLCVNQNNLDIYIVNKTDACPVGTTMQTAPVDCDI